MVVLKDDNKAAIEWPLARIIEVYPGPDDVVRVVKLRMPNGAVFKRQASRLCLLPFEKDSIGQPTNANNPQPAGATPKDESLSTVNQTAQRGSNGGSS